MRTTPLLALLLGACAGIDGISGENGANGGSGAPGEQGAVGPQGPKGFTSGVKWVDVTGAEVPGMAGSQYFDQQGVLWSIDPYTKAPSYYGSNTTYHLTADCTGLKYYFIGAPRYAFSSEVPLQWRVIEDDPEVITPQRFSTRQATGVCTTLTQATTPGSFVYRLVSELDTRIVTPPTVPGLAPFHPIPAE